MLTFSCGRDGVGAVAAVPQAVVRHDGERVPGTGSEAGDGELCTGGQRYRVYAAAVPRSVAYSVHLRRTEAVREQYPSALGDARYDRYQPSTCCIVLFCNCIVKIRARRYGLGV